MVRQRNRRRPRRTLKQSLIRFLLLVLVWLGATVLYYVVFSLFFDTPVESQMKHDTDMLRQQYALLAERYDTLAQVMENVDRRDRNVFNILFESSPYDFNAERREANQAAYEKLFRRSNRQLRRTFDERLSALEKRSEELAASAWDMRRRIDSLGDATNRIPAIQPVINKKLTLLTASYGMRIHPFFKTLKSHQGVDYIVPEGSRVFATADGRVKEVSTRSSTSGRVVVIDHGNGYETSYGHLGAVNVRRGQEVHRGDIIALSGNSGLSLAPHLHYEVRHHGLRVDPIHYFFLELSPHEYERILRIAQSGMQSFD